MAFTQIASIDTLTIGTPAVTPANIVSCSASLDPELQELASADSYFLSTTVGNLNYTITFVTTDAAAYQNLQKGSAQAKTVAVTYSGAATGVDPDDLSLTVSGSVAITCSCMDVIEAVPLEVNGDKAVSQYTITLRAARDRETGADPTFTRTVTLAGGA